MFSVATTGFANRPVQADLFAAKLPSIRCWPRSKHEDARGKALLQAQPRRGRAGTKAQTKGEVGGRAGEVVDYFRSF